MALHDQVDYPDEVLEKSNHHSSRRRSSPRVNGRAPRKGNKQVERVGGESLAILDAGESSSGGQFSLAHELAAALMPQPTTSKLLAEEFGLEFEDSEEVVDHDRPDGADEDETEEIRTPQDATQDQLGAPSIVDFGAIPAPTESVDPFVALTRDVETMDRFLLNLRHLDETQSGSQEPPLEKAASELIRRMNDTIRSREDQVRQLLELEREFRRISVEVGGSDVLGSLDELEKVEGLQESVNLSQSRRSHSRQPSIAEEEEWETRHHSRQASFMLEEPASPVSPHFPSDNSTGSSATLPNVTRFRADTKSLVRSLTSLSEQTQMNGAAVGDAGRKLRALKNKLGTWQEEWDSAEQSRARISEWEMVPLSKRVKGKELAEEQLRAFQVALDDAAVKTKTIMASP